MKLRNRLLAALLVLAAVPFGGLRTSVSAAAETPDAEVLKEYTEIIVNQVNNARAANHLPELSILPVMNHYAQVRAEELTVVVDHDRPDGRDCYTVMKDDKFFYNVAGENIACGRATPVATFEQWMKSTKHRDNILGKDYTHIGIGYTYDPEGMYRYYWTMFLVGEYDSNSTPVVFENQYIPERMPGDANGTKDVNASDASAILIYAASHSAGLAYQVPGQFLSAGDVNADGDVNAIDASIVLAYSAAAGADPNAKIEDYIW
ncbi:MAG: hypothetical protein IKN55_10380 [Oscillospiraceae bacterium]|nr:hypothetical protein [Oscillospiraceae bacterium]